MKRTLFIFALAAMLLHTFSKAIILLSFELNRDLISRTLCVQKDEANNCCKGSCHLKKQLKADEDKGQDLPLQQVKDKADTPLFCEEPTVHALSVLIETFHATPYSFHQRPSPHFSIFHPPRT